MSFEDDHYAELIIERTMIMKSIEEYSKQYPRQKVVDDAIHSFRINPIDEGDNLETFSRDILKTIVRTKRISDKQKNCLVKMLVLRFHDGYEVN